MPALRQLVDAACHELGRDPSTLERSVSITLDQTDSREIPTSMAPNTAKPLTGSPQAIAAGIQAFANEGIGHLQIYLVPNTIESIERFGKVLEALEQSS